VTLAMLSGGPFAEAGNAWITLTYEGVEQQIAVTVRKAEDKTLVTSIRVPEMIYAYVGSDPDLSGAILEVTYGYGYEIREIPLTTEGVTIAPYSVASAGIVRVQVEYEGRTCGAFVSFTSGGGENVLQGLELASDSRTSFEREDPLEGVFVIALYQEGRRERIAVTAGMAPDFSTQETGNYSITIQYGGRATVFPYAVTESANEQEAQEEQGKQQEQG